MKSFFESGFRRKPKPVGEPSRHLAPATSIQVQVLGGALTGMPLSGGLGGQAGPAPPAPPDPVLVELLEAQEELLELELDALAVVEPPAPVMVPPPWPSAPVP